MARLGLFSTDSPAFGKDTGSGAQVRLSRIMPLYNHADLLADLQLGHAAKDSSIPALRICDIQKPTSWQACPTTCAKYKHSPRKGRLPHRKRCQTLTQDLPTARMMSSLWPSCCQMINPDLSSIRLTTILAGKSLDECEGRLTCVGREA